jgi:hypothetical protein
VLTDAELERFFCAQFQPTKLELTHPLLHGDRHLDAGDRVFLAAPTRRIAEEPDDRVPYVFVDRGAVAHGDLGHFDQILIEQVCQFLGFETVGGLGEIGDVREKDRQFLPLGRDSSSMRTGENRIVQLGRQKFGQFGRQLGEQLVLFQSVQFVVRLGSINPAEMAIIANRTTTQLRLRWRVPINAIASCIDATAGNTYMDTRSAK